MEKKTTASGADLTLARIKRVDKSEVYKAYRDWPTLAAKGLEARFEFPRGAFKRACVMGMGGSAAGGDIIAGWISLKRGVEFGVFKGVLPQIDMKGTLAIACSASGQTSETIEMMKTAVRAGATVVCMSSGGRLAEEASTRGLEHARMPKIIAPRYMLPFIVFSCLSAATRGLGIDCEDEARESIRSMGVLARASDVETPRQRNASKRLASQLVRRTPAVMGDNVTRGVGVRFKNALNENAKMHAYFDRMPDLFHNEIQAWENNDGSFLPIFLRHNAEARSDTERANAMMSILARAGKKPVEVRGYGVSLLSQLVTMVYHLDMTTYYAAIALGRDPLPTNLIDELKRTR